MASRTVRVFFILISLFLVMTGIGRAQAPGARLVITESDSSSVPAITLQAYGLTADGTPLDLGAQRLVVTHNGEIIEDVNVLRPVDVGTFTVFLLDVTEGVSAQVPALQEAILTYASPAYMQEGTDYVALYRVGLTDAQQALEPTTFYNSVRNYFASPLEPEQGATALYDSTVGLLNNLRAIVPDPALVPVLVIVSDGTDAVSTSAAAGDVMARARELGIPVHTVWLQNEQLTVGQEAGRNYLAEVAANAGGTAARLDAPQSLTTIFERLAALRRQYLVQYTVLSPQPGEHNVVLSLADTPSIQAETSVTIATATPLVVLNIPPESRALTLPALDGPVRLGFSAAVSWLDGQERALQQAQLQVNGQPIADVPTTELERFTVEVPNLTYGSNRVQLVVLDEQGQRGASPVIMLDVAEGSRSIPAELAPAGRGVSTWLLLCLGGLVLLAIFGFGGFYAYRSGRLRVPSRTRREQPLVTVEEIPQVPAVADPAASEAIAGRRPTRRGAAYLEVLGAETPLASPLALTQEETRLGRSPNLTDIAFTQDLTVSRLHATITWDGQVFRIYDEESTSGTWVNDQQVPDYGIQLIEGDEIFMGKVHLRFRQS